ncbi:VPLPA-CTERM sorting domain-containing protein [Methylocaldum sp. GT1TLB]|uniref:VPLPA-CTERM sorting domain-containing protein n=1 Tax=Methylocaldum sp. GT1TLB TaxID=3438965 RepID=UPI003DA11ADD
MFKLKTFIPPAAVLSLGLAWAPAHAQTWTSDIIDFTLVEGDLGALGDPEVVRDDTGVSLNFNPGPLTFDALSVGAGQADNGNGNGNGNGIGQVDTEIAGFTIRATVKPVIPDQTITDVSWSQNGVYQVTGDGSWVSAFSSLRIVDPETHQSIGDTQAETFSAFGADDGTNGGPWDLTASNSVAADTVEIELTIKDILAAYAPADGFAWIEKDFGSLRIDVSPGGAVAPIPVPASVWLLGSALSGLIMIGRRHLGTASA